MRPLDNGVLTLPDEPDGRGTHVAKQISKTSEKGNGNGVRTRLSVVVVVIIMFLVLSQKKALQVQKTPRPEPEPSPVLNPKRPKETARDAREIAKKLLKSGAIGPIKKVPNRTDQESFKRPCGMERKLLSTAPTLSSYQPFSAGPLPKNEVPDSTAKAAATSKFSVRRRSICRGIIYSNNNVRRACRICTVILCPPRRKPLCPLRVHRRNLLLLKLLARALQYLSEVVVRSPKSF